MAQGTNNNRISVKKVAWIIALMICMIGGIMLYKQTHHITHCTFSIDPFLSNEMQKAIQYAVHQSNWSSNPHALIQQLSDEFPCIATVATQLIPPSHLHITIIGEQPALLVNKSHIITKNGKVIPDHSFARSIILRLGAIKMRTIPADNRLGDQLRSCLTNLPPTLLNRYAITVENETSILLHDTQMAITITCAASQLLQASMLTRCYDIIEQIYAQSDPKKINHKNRWVADIRFHKQIILSQEKGGINHG